MKKLALTLIACLAFFQTAQAATTALTESLLEYDAIINFIGAPNFTTIGPDEFIVDIKRITRRIDVLGTVEYEICTRQVRAEVSDSDSDGDKNTFSYLATLSVIPNPGIGPNIVTVNSIVECDDERGHDRHN